MNTKFLKFDQLERLIAGLKEGDKESVKYLCEELDRLKSRIMDLELNANLLKSAYDNKRFQEPSNNI